MIRSSVLRQCLALLLAALVAMAAWSPSSSSAADRIYWSSTDIPFGLSFANLDTSAAGNLETNGATMDIPVGLAIDPAAGRIYWANDAGNKISFANLDGTGGGDLNTAGATVNSPQGVAVDPAAGRIYWANFGADKISFANLNGTGGGDLVTGGATMDLPVGLAIDPAAGRIYWANDAGNKISFANLDGTGGGDLNTAGATVSSPAGVAIDSATGRIYWADTGADKISFTNLDGIGGGNLPTTGATVSSPEGVALDPAAGRIYWANFGADKISFANLNGTGGGDIPTFSATVKEPVFPALLEAPTGAGAPLVTGGSVVGSQLFCSQGSWAPDLLPSFLYRAPQGFTYSWSRDGQAISGADAPTLTADTAGDYSCGVSANNAAGSSTQNSADHAVAGAGPPAAQSPPAAQGPPSGQGPLPTPRFGSKTLVTLKLRRGRIPVIGPLPVTIANGNGFAIAGTLSGRTTKKVLSAGRRQRIELKPKSFRITAKATEAVQPALPQVLRHLLARTHKLSLVLTATMKDPSGQTRSVTKSVTPRLRTRHEG